MFAQWSGVSVFGPVPLAIGTGGEILHVCAQRAVFPAPIMLLERHFKHTQTYLSANGNPFVMVLGDETLDGLPDVSRLRAFLFKDGAGVVMNPGVWHEFPLALEDDTRFTVVLSAESHINLLQDSEFPNDARGPDLERWDMAARADLLIDCWSVAGS
jgi:ureidoglycolate lyase